MCMLGVSWVSLVTPSPRRTIPSKDDAFHQCRTKEWTNKIVAGTTRYKLPTPRYRIHHTRLLPDFFMCSMVAWQSRLSELIKSRQLLVKSV